MSSEARLPLEEGQPARVFRLWRQALQRLLQAYEDRGGSALYPRLYLFFAALNVICYWLAMFTAFPDYLQGREGLHYFKIQFPVGFLGALFDSLSFFVTVFIIRRALRSRSSLVYVSHLSVDLIIAVLATFWVLFVFIISGWLIHLLTPGPPLFGTEALDVRQNRYTDMLIHAMLNPFEHARNIYFGLIMGISASLPTALHVFLFVYAVVKSLRGDPIPARNTARALPPTRTVSRHRP